MLGKYEPHTTIAASDLERAKTWYAEKLGLKPSREDMFGAWYEAGGGKFLIFPTQYAGTAKNTVMEWTVDDVENEVAELQGRGVEFDTFDMEGVTWNGVVASMGESKAAWFKDSEGNILAISQE